MKSLKQIIINRQDLQQVTNLKRRKDKKTRFYIDTEFIINGYASKYRNISLIDIYSVLAMHANYKTQICFPSIAKIIEESGVKNRNTIFKALKKLEELNMIKIFSTKGRNANRYILLDSKLWRRLNDITGNTVEQYQKQDITVSPTTTNNISYDTRNNINK